MASDPTIPDDVSVKWRIGDIVVMRNYEALTIYDGKDSIRIKLVDLPHFAAVIEIATTMKTPTFE